jgi:hypothetical protein
MNLQAEVPVLHLLLFFFLSRTLLQWLSYDSHFKTDDNLKNSNHIMG